MTRHEPSLFAGYSHESKPAIRDGSVSVYHPAARIVSSVRPLPFRSARCAG
jgi:hypothetical protein